MPCAAYVVNSIVEAMISQVRRALGIKLQLGLDELRDLRSERAIGRSRVVANRGRGERDDESDRDGASRVCEDQRRLCTRGYFSVLANNSVSFSNARSACGWL